MTTIFKILVTLWITIEGTDRLTTSLHLEGKLLYKAEWTGSTLCLSEIQTADTPSKLILCTDREPAFLLSFIPSVSYESKFVITILNLSPLLLV